MLACLEIGARLLGIGPMTARPLTILYRHDPLLGWRQRPGVAVRFRGADFDCHVTSNALGFRDPAKTGFARLGDRRRIVFLGDSALWGYGVEREERYTDLFEEETGIATVNLGQTGYSTVQETLLYERVGVRFAADLVVLAFTASNDLVENTDCRKRPCLRKTPAGYTLAGVPTRNRLGGPGRLLVGHSRFAGWLYTRYRLFVIKGRLAPNRRRFQAEDVIATWPTSLAAIARLDRDTKRRGVPFAVTAADGASFRLDKLRAACQERGIPFLDLNPALSRCGLPCRLQDGHLNPKGHRLVAETIAPFLCAILHG